MTNSNPQSGLGPDGRPRPSVIHSQQAKVRRPRWVLGTFWLLVAIGLLVVGFTGHPWYLLLAVLIGGYAVYLYRGGRYGWFFF